MNEAAKLLGAALRGHRTAQGLSMRALARKVGLSAHGTLVDYEHGRRIPPEDLLVACERALGVEDESLQRMRGQALAELAETRATALMTAPAAPALVPAPPDPEPPATAARRRTLLLGAAAVVVAILAVVAVSAAVRPGGGRLRVGFETSADRWGILWGRQKATGAVTDKLHFEGSHAYAVTYSGASEGHGPHAGYVAFGTTHGVETLRSGMRVTVHMWTSYPANGVRFFVYDLVSKPVWAPETPGNGSELPVSGGTEWSRLTFTVPPVSAVRGIGVQSYAENDDVRVVAIDAVSW